MILTQKNKDTDGASWTYDYKSKEGNYEWNAFLHSSSKVAGQVAYRLNFAPQKGIRHWNIPQTYTYEIRFGAGNFVTGHIAARTPALTNRDLSISKGTVSLSY